MAIRMLRCEVSVTGNASEAEFDADVTQADLDKTVPASGCMVPQRMEMTPENANITIHEVQIRRKDDEQGVTTIIAAGDEISMAQFNRAFGFLSPDGFGVNEPYPQSLGLRIRIKASNASGDAIVVKFRIKIHNRADIADWLQAKKARMIGPGMSAEAPLYDPNTLPGWTPKGWGGTPAEQL